MFVTATRKYNKTVKAVVKTGTNANRKGMEQKMAGKFCKMPGKMKKKVFTSCFESKMLGAW